jgi:lipopolysaccharide biosynthesis protein
VCFVPVFGEPALIARKTDPATVISIDEGDAAIEPLGWSASSLGWFRRRFTALRKTVLKFDGVEIFPEGSKSRTRDYRKLVKSARAARISFDGAFMAAHQELILGWAAEPGIPTEPAGPDKPAIAIAIHLHYVDLWPEIETLLGRWRTPFKLFLTLTSPHEALEQRIRAKYSDYEIRIVENSGRDVRPFLSLLEEGAFDAFDLVCKIHGKRSLRPGYPPLLGELVRRATYLDLIGSDRQVASILTLFENERRLGIVGPERFRASSRHGRPSEVMGASRDAIEAMALKMGGAVQGREYDVFAGTMFWVRPQALAPLRGLRLAGAFAPEAGLSDGALEHAVEGLFNHAVRLAGFEVVGVSAG